MKSDLVFLQVIKSLAKRLSIEDVFAYVAINRIYSPSAWCIDGAERNSLAFLGKKGIDRATADKIRSIGRVRDEPLNVIMIMADDCVVLQCIGGIDLSVRKLYLYNALERYKGPLEQFASSFYRLCSRYLPFIDILESAACEVSCPFFSPLEFPGSPLTSKGSYVGLFGAIDAMFGGQPLETIGGVGLAELCVMMSEPVSTMIDAIYTPLMGMMDFDSTRNAVMFLHARDGVIKKRIASDPYLLLDDGYMIVASRFRRKTDFTDLQASGKS